MGNDRFEFGHHQTTLDIKIDQHIHSENNPHNVTKSQLGLGSVDNVSFEEIQKTAKEYSDKNAGAYLDIETNVEEGKYIISLYNKNNVKLGESITIDTDNELYLKNVYLDFDNKCLVFERNDSDDLICDISTLINEYERKLYNEEQRAKGAEFEAVHKIGDEDVAGIKTFTDEIHLGDLKLSKDKIYWSVSDSPYTIQLGSAPTIYFNDDIQSIDIKPVTDTSCLQITCPVYLDTGCLYKHDSDSNVYTYRLVDFNSTLLGINEYESIGDLPEINDNTEKTLAKVDDCDLYYIGTFTYGGTQIDTSPVFGDETPGVNLTIEKIQEYLDPTQKYLTIKTANNVYRSDVDTSALAIGKPNYQGTFSFDIKKQESNKNIYLVFRCFSNSATTLVYSYIFVNNIRYNLYEAEHHSTPDEHGYFSEFLIDVTRLVNKGTTLSITGASSNAQNAISWFYGIRIIEDTTTTTEWKRIANANDINSLKTTVENNYTDLDYKISKNTGDIIVNKSSIKALEDYQSDCRILNSNGNTLPVTQDEKGERTNENIIYRHRDDLFLQKSYYGFNWNFALLNKNLEELGDNEIQSCCNKNQNATVVGSSHENCFALTRPNAGIVIGSTSETGTITLDLNNDYIKYITDMYFRMFTDSEKMNVIFSFYATDTLLKEKTFIIDNTKDWILHIDTFDIITANKLIIKTVLDDNNSGKAYLYSTILKSEKVDEAGASQVYGWFPVSYNDHYEKLNELTNQELNTLIKFVKSLEIM